MDLEQGFTVVSSYQRHAFCSLARNIIIVREVPGGQKDATVRHRFSWFLRALYPISWPEKMEAIVDDMEPGILLREKLWSRVLLFLDDTIRLPALAVILVDPTGRRFIRRTGAPG